MLFAFGRLDDPLYVWGVVMLSGFALLYSRELPSRLAGLGLCLAALMVTTGSPKSDGEAWGLLLILAILFAIFRPKWLRRQAPEVARPGHSESITVLPTLGQASTEPQ